MGTFACQKVSCEKEFKVHKNRNLLICSLSTFSDTSRCTRCFDKLRGDLFKYKSPPAVFSSQCLLSLINGRREISLCLLSFKLLLGSRCHPALLRTLSSLSNSLPRCQKWKFVRTVTFTLDFLNTVFMCLLPFKPFPPIVFANQQILQNAHFQRKFSDKFHDSWMLVLRITTHNCAKVIPSYLY